MNEIYRLVQVKHRPIKLLGLCSERPRIPVITSIKVKQTLEEV